MHNNMHNNMPGTNLENKILNILDNNNIKLSNSNKYKSESSIIKNLSKVDINKKSKSENNGIDIDVKNLIEKDLGDSDKNTTYNAEENKNYREIFSNSIEKSEKSLNSKYETVNTKEIINTKEVDNNKDTQEKENLKNKKKFFNNYLHI